MLQSFDGGVSPILDSLPQASCRSGRRRETGEILEVLMRFINHHITPLNNAVSEVLEKAVLIAKHLITVYYLLPRSLLLDARGSVSNFNASCSKQPHKPFRHSRSIHLPFT